MRFDADERRRLRGFGAAVLGLHVLGWGLILLYAPAHPVLGGLGVLAYTFGLRHAFDADHISAIDNTTRKLMADGQRPLGVGFFFSLGHSTVVFALSAVLAVAAGVVHSASPALAHYGGTVGTLVSGGFLWVIGLLNLVVLVGVVEVARDLRSGRFDEAALEARLYERGFMSRLLGSRARLIRGSWQMYPIGVLFGLGFDTATEVGLLAITAGVANGRVPAPAILALPTLFAAGMSAMDTADGIFMTKAYGWAFSSPARKVYYNLTVTALSVVVALAIGSVEVLRVLGLTSLDWSALGYVVFGLFAVTWLAAAAVWRWRRVEERWST